MNVAVTDVDRSDIDESALRDFAALILAAEGLASDASLAITFVGSEEIAELNERFMGKKGPTDVLSFPVEDAAPGEPPTAVSGGPPLELGDIFICTDVVAGHADEYGASFLDELYLMVTHGVLHILGWDHQTEVEAEAMESKEAEHLNRIGRARR
ncbi:MAG: hypothetical protein BMS9Abin20_1461 [Acidimicrobiia bacterium]|nr:MAG: hypothetical protein BMS9Abin20_1461 [Acidimicrobiia bacterium]